MSGIMQIDTVEDVYLDPYADAVEEAVDELDEQEQSLESMSEVEIRLEEANALKALLKNPLFEESSDITDRVEKRVRNFIKTELKILLGLEVAKTAPVQVKSAFSEEEEKVLKALAGRVLSKGQQVEAKPEPTVNRATVEKPAVIKPAVAPAVQPSAPQKPVKTEAKKPGRPPKRNKIVEREVNINGTIQKVKLDLTGQVKPEGHKTMSNDEINAAYSTSGLTDVAQSGILNLAMQAINPNLLTSVVIDDGDTH